jgi:hypothetical protein
LPRFRLAAAADVDLRSIVQDVVGATAARYGAVDDRGHAMDTAKILWIPAARAFAAVYHTYDTAIRGFQVHLATSRNLLDWTWTATLGDDAAQPTIAPATDGGYIVAWEQAPDPIHVAVLFFPDWGQLRSARPTRRFETTITTAGCAEGTPSIEAASSRRVQLGFHYFAGCTRDREAIGVTDWQSWRTEPRPQLDRGLIEAGVGGNIGDRDQITVGGDDLMLIEGQLAPLDAGSWRTFLYDERRGTTEPLDIRTAGGSRSLANPTVSAVRVGSLSAIVVTLYLFAEGAAPGEAGELIYYRAYGQRTLPP